MAGSTELDFGKRPGHLGQELANHKCCPFLYVKLYWDSALYHLTQVLTEGPLRKSTPMAGLGN